MKSIDFLYLKGKLRDCEIFLFTYNIMADCEYNKGSSSCKTLFGVLLILRMVKQRGELILHVIYITGTKIIKIGIDCLSRGETGEGVTQWKKRLSFIPLHLDTLERSNGAIRT